jgi:glutathione S-transferase
MIRVPTGCEATMLQIYCDPITVNSRKVLAGLELMEMPYELRRVGFFDGDHKKPEFLAINPNGAVPAAMDGDFALSESNAILQYAAELGGADAHYPRAPKLRADVNRWLFWEASSWAPSCYVYMVENVVKPLMGAQPDAAAIEKEAPNWHRLAGILDARLATSRWMVGEGVTLADIAIAAPMHLHKLQRLPLESHPNLDRWMTGVEQLTCWQKTQAALDAVLKA